MKKFYSLLAIGLCAAASSVINAQTYDEIYFAQATASESPIDPDNKQSLPYNPETGAYEGKVLANTNSFRFYALDGDERIYLGPTNYEDVVSFYSKDTFEGSCGWGATDMYGDPTSWAITNFRDRVKQAILGMSVNTEEGTIFIEFLEPVEDAPEAFYIWGSEDGGMLYSYAGEMDSVGEGIYSATLYVPECNFKFDNPEFGSADKYTPEKGWYFYISSSASSPSDGMLLGAQLEERVFEFEDSDEFSVTLVRVEPAALVCLTPGYVEFTFDFASREFTAKYLGQDDPGSSAVESIGNINEEKVIYNLNGMRVSSDNLSKGIYIINGKKVAITK